MSDGTIYYMSDQKENVTALPKPGGGFYSEKDLCRRVAEAAAANATARGQKAWALDPNKTFSVAGWVTRNPNQIVFIHIESGSSPGPVFAVDCSGAPNTAWSAGLVKAMAAKMPGFPAGKVYLDTNIRFCYWFFRRLLGYAPGGLRILPRYSGRRTVVEMGRAGNRAQMAFIWSNPNLIGKAIAEYCQPGAAPVPVPKPTPVPILPLLSFPPKGAQPGVKIITTKNGTRYYQDAVKNPTLGAFPIAWTQWKLNLHFPTLEPLDVDGVWGQDSSDRMAFFQSGHYGADGKKLIANGVTDQRTWAKVRSL